MSDSTKPPAGDVEAREAALKEAINAYNIGATHNAKNFRDPVAFHAAINYAIDAYLAKLTPTKAEPSRTGITKEWLEAVDSFDEGITVSAGGIPHGIELPKPTPDQVEYLEGLKRASENIDHSQIVGGPKPKAEPSRIAEDVAWLRAQAVSTAKAMTMLQDHRTADYKARGDLDANYKGIEPHETREWNLANRLEILLSRITAIEAERDRLAKELAALQEKHRPISHTKAYEE